MVRTKDTPPLDLFAQGIRSEVTHVRYLRILRQVTCEFLEEWLEGTFEERIKQLVRHGRDDPEWARDLMTSLSRKLRERTRLAKNDPDYLNPVSVPNYFKPIKKLFDMNDVVINWKRVYATYPELDNMPTSAGWVREDISRMLVYTRDPMDRAIILVLASSGVRVGALDQLNWDDLTPVYRVDDKLTVDAGETGGEVACAALEIYRGSSENYTAFITPEAFAALQEYGRVWSKAMYHQAGPSDPIFLTGRGPPGRTTQAAIQKRIGQVVERAGLRGRGGRGRMYNIPLMNGFRRFWNKTCKDAKSGDSALGSLIRKEYMMGHRGLTALDQNYFKTNLLELAAEYVTTVPDLTINNEDRLRLSNRRMADNLRRVEGEKDGVVVRMQEEMEVMSRKYEEMVARLKREKDAEMERMREEMAELKRRGGLPGSDLVAALRDAAGAEGVPGNVIKSLTGMMDQLGKSQKAALKEMQERHDAEIRELRRALDMERTGSLT